jgi:hypothetical protein
MAEQEKGFLDKLDLSGWEASFNQLRQRFGTFGAVLLTLLVIGVLIWWKWEDIAKRPGIQRFIARLTRRPTGRLTDLRIKLFEESRDEIGKLREINCNLSDLLISPMGIHRMLEQFAAAPASERGGLWPKIKSKADETHNRLHRLYGSLETLTTIGFFGRYPRVLNDIGRVIDAKQHSLYQTIRGLSSDEIPDAPVIKTMLEEARALRPLNAQVESIQNKITTYINDNDKFLRNLVVAEKGKPEARVKLIVSSGQEGE